MSLMISVVFTAKTPGAEKRNLIYSFSTLMALNPRDSKAVAEGVDLAILGFVQDMHLVHGIPNRDIVSTSHSVYPVPD